MGEFWFKEESGLDGEREKAIPGVVAAGLKLLSGLPGEEPGRAQGDLSK